MACLLQPECNFLHGFLQVQTPSRSGGCRSENHVHAGNT